MGSEKLVTARFGKTRLTGKALLETSEILFRPADGGPRKQISFSAIKSAKALDGQLHLQTADGPVVFELGAAAGTWCHKILHPKTRIEKLGVKPGSNVALFGQFDPEFLRELRAATKNLRENKFDPDGELIFWSASTGKDLVFGINKAAKSIKGATALWIVYPKGKKEITENEVIAAGRKAGLKDVKVVGFSAAHTALKFVLPITSR